MIAAQLPLGAVAPLVPLLPLVGAFTLWLWGRHVAGTPGRPVAVLAVTISAAVALAVFVWQQTVGATQVLAGPALMVVPGQSAAIDVSFHVDGLSLYLLTLVSGLGALTLALDGGTEDRSRFQWWLLSLASAEMVLLTDNLVLLFAFWELSQIAVWRLSALSGNTTGDVRPPLAALAADFALLLAVVVCGQNFGNFHLSLLAAPETIAALGPNQRAALVLLTCCAVAAAYVRCLQFPFCTPALEAAHRSADSTGALITVVVPAGLYLLLRFQFLIAIHPVLQAALVGLGSLSALLWSGIAVTQPTFTRCVASWFAGTFGLVIAGIGGGGWGFAASLLLGASVTAGCWSMLQLAAAGRGQQHAGTASRAAAVIAVVMCCGILGQEAVLNTAWSAVKSPEQSAEPAVAEAGRLQSTESASEQRFLSPVMPAGVMLAHLLLSLSLFRGLFLHRFTSREPVHDDPPPGSVESSGSIQGPTTSATSSVVIAVAFTAGLAAAPTLSVIMHGAGRPFSAPGVMGLLMLLGLVVAWMLYSGPSAWPARIEHGLGGVATLCRRSFHVEKFFQWMWVFPWTWLALLAAASDRTFLAGLKRRERDAQAGLREHLQASLSEGPLSVYVITLILGAGVMIVLLAGG